MSAPISASRLNPAPTIRRPKSPAGASASPAPAHRASVSRDAMRERSELAGVPPVVEEFQVRGVIVAVEAEGVRVLGERRSAM